MRFPHKIIIWGIFLLTMLLVISVDVWGVALKPEVVQKLQQEGKLQEWIDRWESAAQRGMYDITPDTPLRLGEKGTYVVDSVLKPLVLCVEFTNLTHTYSVGKFDTLLFSKNYVVPTGSMRDYYQENSYGKFDIRGGEYGWIRVAQPDSYYTWGSSGLGTSYPHNGPGLAYDAVYAADPYVNYADYDYNHDGWIDGLIIVHAGAGAEETGGLWDMWSHRWSLPSVVTLDGVHIQSYTMQPEKSQGSLVTIGVFCHEWGHFLGINWEEYDKDYTSAGLGYWSVMAAGSDNNNGRTPAHHSAYCKSFLGWTTVNTVSSNQTNVEILQAETSPVSYRLWTSGGGGAMYFMVENRQKTKFDSYLPGDGLCVYHVDVNMGTSGNQYEWCPGSPSSPHYRTDLEQADGLYHLDSCSAGMNEGDGGDPFPGFWNKRAFDDTTTPNSKNYTSASTQVAVWNISDSDSSMHANLDVTWSRPCLYLDSFRIDDSAPNGNGNGRAEGGESPKIYIRIRNIWLPITSTIVTGRVNEAGIHFSDSTSNLGTIGTGSSVNNYSDPMQFVVDPDFVGKPVVITLHVAGTTTSGPYTLDFNKEIWAGNAEILVADDDAGSASDYRSYYTRALDSLRTIYDTWTAVANPAFSFNKYKYIIWYTGDHKTDLFSPAQVESLMSFLDKGGRLFMSSQDAVEVLSNSVDPNDTLFLKNYLHVGFGGNCGRYMIAGRPGDEVGDTLYIVPNIVVTNQTSMDNLVPDPTADVVLSYTLSTGAGWWTPTDSVAGTKYFDETLGFKVVVFGFGFESIRADGFAFHGQYCSKPHFVMQRVLDWLKLPNPAIDVMAPNGGESWVIGSTYDITWQSVSFTDSVKIEYSTDAGANWMVVDNDDTVYNNGVHPWNIPNTPSDSCLVRISDVGNGNPGDVSDSFFSIINYVPGDANGNQMVELGDIVFLISYLYKSGPAPVPLAAGDANGDCVVDLGDIVYLITYLYKSGPPPLPGCA